MGDLMNHDYKKCKICGSKINSYDFYVTDDKKEFFCSNDCCKSIMIKLDIRIIFISQLVEVIMIVKN